VGVGDMDIPVGDVADVGGVEHRFVIMSSDNEFSVSILCTAHA
jgi:hypothetical protein